MSKFHYGKKLPLFAVISAVLIIFGAVMVGLFGFNRVSSTERAIEVSYDAIVTISKQEEKLEELCEKTFSGQGLKVTDKQMSVGRDTSYLGETGEKLITYKFSSKTSEEALNRAVETIRTQAESQFGEADVYVRAYVAENAQFYTAIWRGAVALGVAAIVALIYVGIRYGVGNAIAGLAAVVNDTLVTVALLVITRIPVYAYTPVLFAGFAAVFSVILWITQCAKMKANFKDPSYQTLSAAEAVAQSCQSSYKTVLLFVIPFAAVFAIFGAVASAGVRLFFLPALLPLAVSVYSSLLLAPAVFVPLKAKFDRMKASGRRYAGKKKAEAKAEAEE